MLEAFLWGFVGGGALIVGALAGLLVRWPTRAIGVIMGFGVGVLISAVAFELTDEAFKAGGAWAVAIGLALGALVFYAADTVVEGWGGRGRKASDGRQTEGGATGIVVGALLDGIPESVVIGASLLGGGAVGAPVVIAVFISNVPEALSAATGLQRAGRSRTWILGLWTGVALISALASGLGYGLLGSAPEEVVAGIQAFAAGAILTMLASTMMPEAVQSTGRSVGLVTVVGFAVAFLISRL